MDDCSAQVIFLYYKSITNMKTMDALYKNTLDGFLASAWSKFTVSRTKWGMSIFQGNHLSPIPYYQNILSAAESIVSFIYTFLISFLSTSSSLKIWNSIWTNPFTFKKVCYLKENMQLLPIPFTGTAKWYFKLIVWVANWATATVVFASWARIELISSTCEWTRIWSI